MLVLPFVLPFVLLRRLLVVVVTLVALIAVLVPGGRPAQAATPLSDKVGFSPGAGLLWVSDADLARELDLMVSSGAGWLRLDFDWASIEHVRGTYNWKNLDRVVGAARSRGLQVLALPAYTPVWARPAGTSTHYPPSDPAPFAAFAAAAAARYVPQGVTTYEIWNEPNIPNFWEPKPDVPAYARMLAASAAAIRAVAPGATVLSGGLSPSVDSADGSYVDPRTFLTKLYAQGAGSSFDGVAVHPYSFPALPTDPSTASWNTFQKMTTMRQTMVANGDAHKQIWLTETGAPTGTSAQAVSETTQAAIITETLAATATLSWAGPVFLYAARDAGTDPSDREDNFGLVRRDFTPKAAWRALLSSMASTATTPSDASLAPRIAPVATAPVAPAPVAVPPAAPEGLRSSGVRGTITSTWKPGAGATSYVVERTSVAPGTAGRTWTSLGSTVTAAYVDDQPGAGRQYYRVVARNGALASAASAESSAVAGSGIGRSRPRLSAVAGSDRRGFGPRIPGRTP